jgi:DNA-binding CsgD family transcriptional regulator
LFRADYEEFERLLDTYEPINMHMFELLRAIRALEQGDVDRAVRSLPDPTTFGTVPYLLALEHGVRCAVFWLAGRHGDAATEFQQSLDAAEATGARGLRAGAGLSPADGPIAALAPYMFEVAAAYLANEEERAAIEVIVRSQPGLTAGRMTYWPWCAQRVYGEWALVLGMDEDAERLFADALEWCERERGPIEAGRCHQGLAEVAVRQGDAAEALERLDAAAALFERHGATLYFDQLRARREELAAPEAGPESYPAGLSEREVEVLRMMAGGRSNREIAEALVIAPATVASHVRNILTKTNTPNRAAAGSWAARQGLTDEAAGE